LGATFTIQLPLLPNQPTPSQEPRSSEHPHHLNKVQVLLVDDETDSLVLATHILEFAGATVFSASSAHAALAALTQFHPDILISDIGMPEVDGYELIKKVRSLPLPQGGIIPAIALTAYAGEFDREQVLAAGFQQHLSKPIDPETLIETVAVLVSDKF
jgi:CheY-like chemotaxis protein